MGISVLLSQAIEDGQAVVARNPQAATISAGNLDPVSFERIVQALVD